MLTRRDVLKAGAAGVSVLLASTRAAYAAAPQPRTKVNFDVPAGACDCHVHVFGDPKQYPFFSGRTYSPDTASVDELRQLLSALRLERVVIVQPSVYGTDNRCTLDGMRALGDRARGVAVIDEKTTDAELDAMAKAGIRGIRLNLATAGVTDPAVARKRWAAAVDARQEPRMAHPDQHAAQRHRRIERSVPELAGARRHRSLRWSYGRRRRSAARLRRAGQSDQVGKGAM